MYTLRLGQKSTSVSRKCEVATRAIAALRNVLIGKAVGLLPSSPQKTSTRGGRRSARSTAASLAEGAPFATASATTTGPGHSLTAPLMYCMRLSDVCVTSVQL